MGQRIYLGLGANLGDRLENLRSAVRRLSPAVALSAVSPLYETVPIGDTDQPPFFNAVCAGETGLEPENLLDRLKLLEKQAGRIAGPLWGPRPLDLDILLYGEQIVESERLRIPHARLAERAFVLRPLCDLAPELVVPGLDRSVRALLSALGEQGVRRICDRGWER